MSGSLLPADELVGVEALTDAGRLHALALASAPDVPAARRALSDALA